MKKYDLIVIGSGPGGQRAAIQAAKLGKDVAIVERREIVGGVTAHTGTIPSKTLRETVLHLSGFNQRCFYGQGYRAKHDITVDDLLHRLQSTISQQIQVIQDQLTRNGVHTINGTAAFVDKNTVQVVSADGNETRYQSEYFVVASGTVPRRPDNIPFNESTIIDSDGILGINRIPRTMTIIGGGVIGVEYATIFSALDVKVTVIDGRNQILDFIDTDIIDDFRHDIKERGVLLRLGEQVTTVEEMENGYTLAHLKSGKRVKGEVLMVAAGRTGATADLDLSNVGLTADEAGRIVVDDNYRTTVENIYAVGDVIGFPALASTSAEQGRFAACHAFNNDTSDAFQLFPFGIYAIPAISVVGKTEQELRAENTPYEMGTARLKETARGQIRGNAQGLLKLLFSLEDRRLLGVHIVGEGATELIHIGQAVIAHGGTLDYFVGAVFNYPTLAEAYKIAALDAWNRISL
jgi:NAD(P) transhydrogenase